MGDKSILTHEDIEQAEGVTLPPEKDKEEKKKDSPKDKTEKKKKIKVQFECPFAPMGEANTVIRFKHPSQDKKDIEYKIPLNNKLYTMPDDLSEEEEKMLRTALEQNGFRDVTTIHAGMKYEPEKQKYTYSVVHPEHTERNPVNGNISLAMVDEKNRPICGNDGKQISKQVAIIDGVVKTDDEQIYEALLRAGFYSGHKKVRE